MPRAIKLLKRNGRYYANFAPYGGKLKALKIPGEKQGTTDPIIAQKLLADALTEMEGAKRSGAVLGLARTMGLEEAAVFHLREKERSGKYAATWLDAHGMMLARAVAFLGAQRELQTIGVADVRAWLNDLRGHKVTRGHKTATTITMTDGTLRHHLNVLSNLYKRAQSETWVPTGYNPVASLMDKPSGKAAEAKWLEVHEAALVLEAAARLPAAAKHLKSFDPEFTHALVATFLLTGGREADVLGLEVEDVSFDCRTVTFRPNEWSNTKSRRLRVVPLWPQLEEILRPYVFGRPLGRLLFPSYLSKSGGETMIQDWRKVLDRVAALAGWQQGEIRSRMFRHTYCAARLQTTDGGAPVAIFTVSRELGHGSEGLVKQIYGHLGTVRHRAEVVEYRCEQHANALAERRRAMADRLTALEAEEKAREERKRAPAAVTP